MPVSSPQMYAPAPRMHVARRSRVPVPKTCAEEAAARRPPRRRAPGVRYGGDVLAAQVDVGRARADGVAGDDQPFDELMRVALDDLPVLEGAGLALVAVAGEVASASGPRLRHEAPLHAGAEAGAAAAAQTGGLDFLDAPRCVMLVAAPARAAS